MTGEARPMPQVEPDRRALRALLLARFPWLADTDHGPQSVEPGECDRCGAEARLVTTCGPGPGIVLGRRCALGLGAAAWCDGHGAEARTALVWLQALPPVADEVARLWWVATGEVRIDPALLATRVAALERTAGGDGP